MLPVTSRPARPTAPTRRGRRRRDVHWLVEGASCGSPGCSGPRSDSGLEGHSDGDVVAHAACDALLSAAGLGDLGSQFGTSDPAVGRRERCRLLDRDRGSRASRPALQIGNVAVQLVGNVPKVGRGATRPNTCSRTAAGASVTLTATTTDGLGLTGRGEGLAAIATALVSTTGLTGQHRLGEEQVGRAGDLDRPRVARRRGRRRLPAARPCSRHRWPVAGRPTACSPAEHLGAEPLGRLHRADRGPVERAARCAGDSRRRVDDLDGRYDGLAPSRRAATTRSVTAGGVERTGGVVDEDRVDVPGRAPPARGVPTPAGSAHPSTTTTGTATRRAAPDDLVRVSAGAGTTTMCATACSSERIAWRSSGSPGQQAQRLGRARPG